MHKQPAIDLFDSFAEDLLCEQNARLLVIIGASKVDDLLYEILSLYLLPKRAKPKEQDELLDGDRPLSTLSARIKMCCRLGLIDQTFYLTLEQLRVLRNLSAHSIAYDIAKSPMREHIAELRKRIEGRESFRLTRERYFDNVAFNMIEELQCLLLTMCVLLQAIRENIKRTKGNKSALSIATK
jgi:hypothetical protein